MWNKPERFATQETVELFIHLVFRVFRQKHNGQHVQVSQPSGSEQEDDAN